MKMEQRSFIIKGNICYTKTMGCLDVADQAYLVCEAGVCQGVFPVLPSRFKGLPMIDYKEDLVIPGMVDLHVHAPQYPFRGLGMDLELMEWLQAHTFPEESRYADLAYAKDAYETFVRDLQKSVTTRAVVFGTVHTPATELLMGMLDACGLVTYVGKVNMDQNCPDSLQDGGVQEALAQTAAWLQATLGKYRHTYPVLTPRFAPACSGQMLEGLGKLQKEYGVPVQSHLSENLSEIALVTSLFPWASCYGDVYTHYGLFGGAAKTVMAHCVYSSDREVKQIKENGVYVAHCPQSNTNLSSGIAPIRKYLDRGVAVGLGTDIAGGATLSMLRCITDAVGVSKLYWRLVDQQDKPLSMEEAFYLATKGGGAFFGNVGSFEEGYELDALVLDDREISSTRQLSTKERLERYLYLAQEGGRLVAKYVAGAPVLL